MFKEWSIYENELKKNQIECIDLETNLDIKKLPKLGFLRSRFTYILTYLFSIIRLHKFLKKEDIKFSKSKDQIWKEVFSKKMTSNKQESKIFSLHSFFPQKRISYAVAATVLVLLGVTYFNIRTTH